MPNTHRTNIQMRFCDTDALGHVNNARYAEYVEVARLEFLGLLGSSVRSLILASLQIDYRRQVEIDEAIHIETWIDKLGTSSIAVAHTVFAGGARAADVKSIVVHFDYASGKSKPLTDDMRRALEGYLVA
jgi:acyl-CoA thioester hydrolase